MNIKSKAESVALVIKNRFSMVKETTKELPEMANAASSIALGGMAVDNTSKALAATGIVVAAVGNIILVGTAAKIAVGVGMGALFMGVARGFRAGMQHNLNTREA